MFQLSIAVVLLAYLNLGVWGKLLIYLKCSRSLKSSYSLPSISKVKGQSIVQSTSQQEVEFLLGMLMDESWVASLTLSRPLT